MSKLQRSIWLGIILLISLFNAADAVLTLRAIFLKYGYEANPLMAMLINVSPLLFLFVKLFISVIIVPSLFKKIDSKSTKITTLFLLLVYSLIMVDQGYILYRTYHTLSAVCLTLFSH